MASFFRSYVRMVSTRTQALQEIGTLPSAQIFAECQISGTRQRPPLPSAALGETWHSANRALPSVWHSAK
jgi:hypothetical protein